MFRTPLAPLSLSLSDASSSDEKHLAPPLSPTLSDTPSSPRSALKQFSDEDRTLKTARFEPDEPAGEVNLRKSSTRKSAKHRQYPKLSPTERHYLNKTFV